MPKLNRILYVEDDPALAKITTIILRDLGKYTVKHCALGSDALTHYITYMPDLILMDVMMPGIDGKETCKRIKQSETGKNIPVIFLTANTEKHNKEHYIEVGGCGLIEKPFDPMTLCDRIEKIWQTQKA